MAVTACLIAVVEASEETVWHLQTTPEGCPAWADAELLRAEPPVSPLRVIAGRPIRWRA